MASFMKGKGETTVWARMTFPKGSTCLDVGACDGVWHRFLGEYLTMDAVEVFEPNIKNLTGYRTVYNMDIDDLKYDWYDLIIFGDVIEHMEVEKAQRVLRYAYMRCKDMVIAVPFLYKQGAIYGNKWEMHIQDDLTKELFDERYKGFELLFDYGNYGYYHKAR